MATITVVIADKNRASRAACLEILQTQEGILVVGVARNGLEAVLATAKFNPNILIINSNLANGRRDENLLRGIRQKSPWVKVIVLSRRASKHAMLQALTDGAQGYLKEGTVGALLPKAVRTVDAGEPWFPRRLVGKILARVNLLATGGEEKNWDIVLKYIGPKYN